VEEDFANFLEDFCDFLDSLEEAVQKMKTQIGKLVGVIEKQKWDWNPDGIRWVKAEGSKGEFEKSEDFNNPEFKKMLKDLAEHNGKLTRDGVFIGFSKTVQLSVEKSGKERLRVNADSSEPKFSVKPFEKLHEVLEGERNV